MALNSKQQAFAAEYLIDLNATRAAIRAGYSAKTAKEQGSRLLTVVNIQKSIQAGQQARAERTEITQDYVLRSIWTTVQRCQGEGNAFDPSNALKGLEILGRHLGLFQRDNEQGKERLVIIKDFSGGTE